MSQAIFTSKVIRASAGSGKTQALTNRYLSLILAGERPEKILATTFTRKAAGEICERIFKRLASACLDQSEAIKLKDALELDSLNKDQLLSALVDLSRNLHNIQVSTLDSFFVKLSRAFCFELGLNPGWSISEAAQLDPLIEEAVSEVCKTVGYEDLARLVSQTKKGDASRSIHQTLINSISPLRSLINITREDQWSWMQEQQEILPADRDKLIAAFSELSAPTKANSKEPNQNWQKALTKCKNLLVASDWHGFLESGFVSSFLGPKKTYYQADFPEPIAESLNQLILVAASIESNRFRNRLLSAYQLGSAFSSRYSKLAELASIYSFQELKELIALKGVLFDLTEVYYRLDSSISHLLFDEFQDTSATEWNILKPIVDEILSKAGLENSFFCVGDAKQAIYGWRGGVSGIFDSLEQDWPQLEPGNLGKSYRSAPEVIETVNRIFNNLNQVSGLAEHPEITKRWQTRYLPHETACLDLKGEVSIQYADKDVPTFKKAAQLVNTLITENLSNEIAILVRTNKAVAEARTELDLLNIPSQEVGGNLLGSSPAVKLILAFLQLLDYPGDTRSQFLISNSPLSKFLDLSRNHLEQALTKLRLSIFETGFGNTVASWVSILTNSYPKSEIPFLEKLSALAFEHEKVIKTRFSEFERLTSNIRVEQTRTSVVKVMTIHQSKGLEFDCVVLPDLTSSLIETQKFPNFIAQQEHPLEPPIKIAPRASAAIRNVISEINEVHYHYESETLDGALCLVYVALTRARRGLHLILKPQKDSKSLSFRSIIEQTLNLKHSESAEYYKLGQLAPLRRSAQLNEERLAQPSELHFKKTNKNSRTFSFVSPSKLALSRSLDVESILTSNGSFAKRRGTLIHKILSEITWLNNDTDPLAEVVSTFKDSNSPAVQEAIATIKQGLQAPELREVFSKSSYKAENLELKNEYRFLIRDDDVIINGSCDRIVFGYDKTLKWIEVIDFKTGKSEPDLVLKQYTPQIECYRIALSKIFELPTEKISAKLVLIDYATTYSI